MLPRHIVGCVRNEKDPIGRYTGPLEECVIVGTNRECSASEEQGSECQGPNTRFPPWSLMQQRLLFSDHDRNAAQLGSDYSQPKCCKGVAMHPQHVAPLSSDFRKEIPVELVEKLFDAISVCIH